MILYPDIIRRPIKQNVPHWLKIKHRPSELVAERVQFARKMREQGYSLKEIGKMMNRHHSTIVHYLHHYNDR